MIQIHKVFTGIIFMFAMIGCWGCTKKVGPADLKKDLVSAELVLPPTYSLGEKISDVRAKLSSENSDKWSIPVSDLAFSLRLINRSSETVRFAHPSDCYRLSFDLAGQGATYIWAPNSIQFTGPRMGAIHSLKPGESFDISFKSLDPQQRYLSWRGFLTQTGTVRIRGSFEARCVNNDTDAIQAKSNWAAIEVVE